MEAMSTVAIEVEDLDAAGLLDGCLRGRAAATGWSSAASSGIAYQWCVQHPATSETGTATWGDAGLPGLS